MNKISKYHIKVYTFLTNQNILIFLTHHREKKIDKLLQEYLLKLINYVISYQSQQCRTCGRRNRRRPTFTSRYENELRACRHASSISIAIVSSTQKRHRWGT